MHELVVALYRASQIKRRVLVQESSQVNQVESKEASGADHGSPERLERH